MLTCLRTKTPDQVLRALPLTTTAAGFQQFAQEAGRVIWGPIVDGLEVPDQPRELFERGLFSRVPIIIGTNRDEGWTFVDRSYPTEVNASQYENAVRTEFGMDADAILRLYPATLREERLVPFVSQPLALRAGEQVNFTIDPQSTRQYVMQTFGQSDTVVVLFEDQNGDLRYVAGDDDSGTSLNARIQTKLYKGRRYVLRIRLYTSSATGGGAVMLS